MHGKMLRTKLAVKLSENTHVAADSETLAYVCAAIELVHTASLCHDDVIDNGLIRRGKATLWKATSPSAAVLIGDLLFCESILLVHQAEGGRYLQPFISKVKEVCSSEIDQEMLLRWNVLDERTCMRLARGKTGPLFALVGLVLGRNDPALSSALEETGYYIGTAYQLADDLLDIAGDERITGKTLGTDSIRGKFTLPQSPDTTTTMMRETISDLCISALERLNDWPDVRTGLENYIENDLQPTFNHIDLGINISL